MAILSNICDILTVHVYVATHLVRMRCIEEHKKKPARQQCCCPCLRDVGRSPYYLTAKLVLNT